MFEKPITTLIDLLRTRATEQPGRPAFTFWSTEEEIRLTYAELDRRARAVGALLQQTSQPGERALLLYPPGADYLVAFFGCLYAGILAVPAYPPRLNGSLERLQAIVADAAASVALTTEAMRGNIAQRFAQTPGLLSMKWLATDQVSLDLAENWENIQIAAETLAFLQYTSGSTSTPKGVMLSHGNLLHNLQLIQKSFATTPESDAVIWLPPYHDMGLIGGLLQPLHAGFHATLLSPYAFMQRPLLWLEQITQRQARVSGGPNFAYDLCVQKVTEEQKRSLDLSAWEVAFTGAEPIRPETLERFAAAFADCGFRREAFYACYGLAEATLFVTGGCKSEPPLVQTFAVAALADHRVAPAAAGAEGARTLVSSGQPRDGQQVVIVDPQTKQRCADDQVGEIWVAGPSVAQGYWQRPELTAETFGARLADKGAGPFLRTGDLGFLRDRELYVTGRLKDLIIIRGQNLYPQDIEYTVQESHIALRPGCGAAFTVEADGAERVVVVQEIERQHRKADLDEVVQAIRSRVFAVHQLSLAAVVLIRPATAPLTSSGKIQRHACRERFLQGTLDVLKADLQGATMSRVEEAYADQREAGYDREQLLQLAPGERLAVLETFLAEKTAQLMRLSARSIDRDQPLGALGLDSLLAVEVKDALETNFGVVLPLVAFLDGPSIAELAAQVLAQMESEAQTMIAAPTASDLTPAALSYGQRSLWFMQRLSPDSSAYNIAHAVRIPGALHVGALQQAFQQLVDRHPQLRTTFPTRDEQPVQQVHAQLAVAFAREDAKAWTAEQLQRQLSALAHEPFDLAKGPLLRLHLFATAEQEHVLLLCVHHIIADFWSLGVLVRDLQQFYAAALHGTAPVITALHSSYIDHAIWQTERLSGAEGERLWSYWQAELGGELPVLNLPTDRQRPPVQSYRGAAHAFTLDPAITANLKTRAQAEGVTLFVLLLSLYQILLHRYTGQDDILVGTPTTGRSSAKQREVIGYFVNPVTLRAQFQEGQTFANFLHQTRQTVLAALQHQEYPFPLLVENLQPQRDPSYPPLFQTVFVLQQSHLPNEQGLSALALGVNGAQLQAGDLLLEALAIEQRTAQYDLTLTMAEADGTLHASFEYNSDLFDLATVARMATHLQTLTDRLLADPEQAIAHVPLLTAAEAHQLLVEWNTDRAAAQRPACIHQLFEEQAARSPERVAVVFAGQTLTYGELNGRANQLARHLQTGGVGPDVLVGICMERSLDMVVAVYGVLKAGGAYLPLDPVLPAERLHGIIEDAQLQLVLTQQSLQKKLQEAPCPLLDVVAEWPTLAQESSENVRSAVTTDNLAYSIYTSGSTGKPKGSLLTHSNVMHLVAGMDAEFDCTEADVWLSVVAIGFDVSIPDLFYSLAKGCKLVLLAEEEIKSAPLTTVPRPDSLLDQFVRHGVTVMACPPALAKLLIENPLLCTAMQSLRYLKLGGEALAPALAQKIKQQLPARLFNMYGPSEATVYSVIHDVLPTDTQTVPIGHRFGNTRLYVLDRHLQPVPIGVVGELLVGGGGVGRGFLNRPQLTAEKYLPDHFSKQPGAQMYRSGDLVRYRTDGLLEYVGRLDHQVKIRGFRIEIGEIEAVITAYPRVQETLVIAYEAAAGGKSLAAYVVPEVAASEQEGALTVNELRAAVQAKLPHYMVPAAFVFLDAFPLTANGKIDRRALPSPELAQELAGHVCVAPRTPTETVLAAIWADVLHKPQIGVTDDFFAWGGHSLLATQVMARLGSALQMEVPLSRLFEYPTVAELAAYIDSTRAEDTIELPPITPIPRAGSLPLSFAQERMWFFEQMQAGTATYHIAGAVRMTGALDVSALQGTFQAILQRHEALRSRFVEQDGRVQVLAGQDVSLELPVIDLRHLPAAERETAAWHHLQEVTEKPFDLRRDTLLRTTLLQLSDAEHWLQVTLHHIVADGWTLGIFIGEMAALYQAFLQGQVAQLPALAIQYADYAHWQRAWLRGEVLTRQLAYWKRNLQGELPVLQLPTDRPRPAVQTFHGAGETVKLSAALSNALRERSRQEGVTLFMLLLAAFQTLLHRYSGQDDIVVGSPIAGRNREELEPLIGLFVNTLVLRTDLSGAPTFRELLGRVREVALGAYAHQDVPFEKLVEELQPTRSLTHSPLFQVMFALQNTPASDLQLEGLSLQMLPPSTSTTKFDLTLSLTDSEAELFGVFEYNTDLFDAATIKRMIGHWQTLLEAVVAEVEQPITTLPLLTAAEREQLLVQWSGVPAKYPADRCLHQLFEAQAARGPEALAVLDGAARITYGELNRRANQLAQRLQRNGVGRGVLVGICMERSLEMIVAILGTLKAGGAYVPLDATYPPERLAFLLADTQTTVVLTQERLREKLPVLHAEVICLERGLTVLDGEPETAPACAVAPDDLAYVIYTSGTTGQPKGALLPHRGVVNMLDDFEKRRPLQPGDRFALWANFGFDLSVYEVFSGLFVGGCLHLLPEELRADSVGYFNWLAASDIQCAHLPPFMLKDLLQWLQTSTTPLSLRRVMVGVESVPELLLAEIAARLPAVTFVNAYGPSEASIITLMHTFDPQAVSGTNRHVPIGKPVQNTHVYLLDHELQPVPIGVLGEVHLGGISLGHGYWNRPELTTEKFIANPFYTLEWHNRSPRLYKTGDIARYLPDGSIEYISRRDNQVKLRGFRIELGEIETALLRHPAIRETVVAIRESSRQSTAGKTLVGYVVFAAELFATGQAPSTSELRQFLKATLPDYMIPTQFVTLAELPLTANGKIDRRALPAPTADSRTTSAYVAPRSALEELLAALFAEVLGVEQVGSADNFFERGGHSLLATQLIARIRSACGVELPLRSLFETGTVAELAVRVALAQQADTEQPVAASSAPALVPLPREGQRIVQGAPSLPFSDAAYAFPLSFAQQRLWFLEQFLPGNTAYNIPIAVRLQGHLHLSALEESLGETVRRQEALRTSFALLEGQPMQVIDPTRTVPLPLIDLREVAAEDRERLVQQLAGEEARRAFDLTEGPLVRTTLLRSDEQEHVLLLTMHHIIADGWSMGVFLQEIAAHYNACVSGQPAALPLLPVQYADFAHWQQRWLDAGTMARQLAYWQQKLAGRLPVLQLPTDRTRPHVQTFRGANLPVQIGREVAQALQELGQREGVTLYMVLLAAFQTLLHRYTGETDILVGSPIAGRTREEVEGLIGFFVNTLVLRTELSGQLSFRELLEQVRDVALEAYAHQDVPFEKLVEELQPERDLSHTPLFQVMFILQNAPLGAMELPELTLQPLAIDNGTAKFDITLSLTESEQGLDGWLEYSTDLFDEATMQRLLAHFQNVLAGILANLEQRLADIPLLTAAEREQVVVEWNDTAVAFPEALCAHHLFEVQAAWTPDAVAVNYGEDYLTYRELNQLANQTAHHLRALGVGPDVCVGLCMERSLELVIGLLAIHKAGGAYVPLDPAYPQDRLAFMVADTELPVVLTQSHVQHVVLTGSARAIALDQEWEAIAAHSAENPVSAVTPDHLGYVLYTSGSTGLPKGVAMAHRPLYNLIMWQLRHAALGVGARTLQFTSLNFDVSFQEIFATLASGGTLVLLAEQVRKDPWQLLQVLVDQRIERLFLPFVALQQLAEAGAVSGAPLPIALREINTAGEQLQMTRQIVDWLQQLPHCRLHNQYGPSESHVVTQYTLQGPVATWPALPPIGRPIANAAIYLLDAARQPVPIGVPGELYIGGTAIARGYLHRPELTAERFLQNPFVDDPQARLYKTGDLALYLPDGNIKYLGRIDQQVKMRGFRIELGEIEETLTGHSAVHEAVALVREDVPGVKQLVAYLVTDRMQQVTISDLRRFLQAKLPDYMVPTAFVFLDALPLTPSGKVDRRALPQPEQLRPDLQVAYVAPETELELAIVEVWQEVLPVERVGVHDNFFELGGHSLLVVQVHHLLRERLGLELTVVQLFQYPTISTLADFIRQGENAGASALEQSQNRAEQRRESKSRRQERAEKRSLIKKGDRGDES